ncbi:MAG: hypothetical protein PHD76_05085 [Methylacidiphilales bacterium]|nr:hypothetical protein [Candidatus Methylacidiphilales bacterium]
MSNRMDTLIALTNASEMADHLMRVCRHSGRLEDADKFQDDSEELDNQISRLRIIELVDWAQVAANSVKNIKASTTTLDKVRKDIENEVNLANNIISALGVLDQLIQLAKGTLV